MLEAEKILRDALDEPAPPDPPEPSEDSGDGGHHHHHCLCWHSPLIVSSDGGLLTTGWGTAVVCWFVLGSWSAVYVLLGWLGERLQMVALVVVWVSLSVLAFVVIALSVHGIQLAAERWRERRARA